MSRFMTLDFHTAENADTPHVVVEAAPGTPLVEIHIGALTTDEAEQLAGYCLAWLRGTPANLVPDGDQMDASTDFKILNPEDGVWLSLEDGARRADVRVVSAPGDCVSVRIYAPEGDNPLAATTLEWAALDDLD